MRNEAKLLRALLLGLVLTACRDGVAPFTPHGREVPESELRQLTFGLGHERDPQWARDGTAILYHADAWFDAPQHNGTLLRIPARGGLATFLAPDAQRDPMFRLLLPVPSPDGQRIAYLHLLRERPVRACTLDGALPGTPCPFRGPLLDTAVLRVRTLGAGGSVFDDTGVGINFEGASRAVEPPFIEQVHPYHEDHLRSSEVSNLRASWSPDGTRLVFSDGLRLLVWRVGDAAAVPIPNTADGVAPHWSPDGQHIAFGIIRRGSERTVSCNCSVNANSPPITAIRTGWEVDSRLIATIRPDGSDLRILGEGSEPAWTPAGDSLYFRRGDLGLFRMGVSAGAGVLVPGTEGARAPMLAPDGSAVAFGRWRLVPNQNLWTLQLRP